jgi:signal peptidase I
MTTSDAHKRPSNSVAIPIIAALALAAILKIWVFDFMVVEGSSMYPNVKGGSIILINRLAYGVRNPYFVVWRITVRKDYGACPGDYFPGYSLRRVAAFDLPFEG